MEDKLQKILDEHCDWTPKRIEGLKKELLNLFVVSGCYSIEDVKRAVNFWSMTDVEKKYIEAFFNNR